MTPRPLRPVFAVAAACFVAAAASHVARGVGAEGADRLRHVLFVAIDLLAALGLLVRPRWLWAPFAALTAQQLHGHGGQAWADWSATGRPAAVDVAVALFMPAVLALLVREARAASPAQAQPPHGEEEGQPGPGPGEDTRGVDLR